MMRVGVLEVRLDLYGVRSLKEKRGVVKSVLAKVRNRFEMAAAEVAHQDELGRAGLGFSCVGNDTGLLQSRMNKVIDFIEQGGQGVIGDYRMDVVD